MKESRSPDQPYCFKTLPFHRPEIALYSPCIVKDAVIKVFKPVQQWLLGANGLPLNCFLLNAMSHHIDIIIIHMSTFFSFGLSSSSSYH